MHRNLVRMTLVLAMLAGITLLANAQDPKQPKKDEGPPRDDYREFFRKPETIPDFWRIIKFEIEVGRYDLAARALRGMVEKKPDDKDLLEIEEKEGMSAFLRLLTVPQWSKDPKLNAQAIKDAQELTNRATTALKNLLSDPVRIEKFVKNLNGDDEERAYALKELYRSGPLAVLHLIDAVRATEGNERLAVLTALPKLGKETLPPLLAALDINLLELRLDLIDVFQKKHAKEAIPFLWYLSASPQQPERVRRKATEALAQLLETPASKLPPAKLALTKEAERYYKHQVPFTDPRAVKVWRWDGKRLVESTLPGTRAEEYYGLRFAGQALDLDPAYQPAQIIFLSLALEKGVEQAGLEQPLGLGAPAVSELVATTSPELLTTVLDRALTEHRLATILGAVRALGDLADVKGSRPATHGQPALVKALNYPDRRVQFAAADSILRIPGMQNPLAGTRVVEVLRRTAAVDTPPKAPPRVLVGFADQDLLNKVGGVLKQIELDPVMVRSGRDVLRRLNESADIDAILIDSALPDPGLSSLLGQLRADLNGGRLPLIIATPRDRESGVRSLTEGQRNIWVVPAGVVIDPESLQKTFLTAFSESGSPPLFEVERRDMTAKAVVLLGLLAAGRPPGYDIRPAANTLMEVLQTGKVSEGPMLSAIAAVGQLPGQQPQIALANYVLDNRRPGSTPILRFRAAQELARHIQQHGLALGTGMVRALEELWQKEPDAGVRSAVGVVLGSMRPDARVTGERLKTYTPQIFPPEPPPKEPPPKEKEKEKEKEKP